MRQWRCETDIKSTAQSHSINLKTSQMTEKTTRTKAVQKSTFADLKAMLDAGPARKRLEEVMGKKVGPFVSSLISAVNGNEALQKADPHTIVGAALIAATLDLPIIPGLGFAGIVPFWNSRKGTFEGQFQVFKKGYIQLAQRSGQVKTIHSGPVCQGQLKKYDPFTGEYEFQIEKESDLVIGYVAFMRLINGFEKYKYMSIEEIEKHAKKYSQSYRKGTGKWTDKEEGGFEQMCEKTAIKLLLSNYAPLSVDMQNAIRYDQAVITGGDHSYPDNDDAEKNQEAMELEKRRMKIVQAINGCTTQEQIDEIMITEDLSEFDLTEVIDRRREAIKNGTATQTKIKLP